MKTLNQIIARLRSRAGREEGFTLIEVMVAVAVLFIALLALARTATVAFTDIAASRQRQTANQLANQLLEEVRAIPYESVKRGLKTNQLTGDPNIRVCSGVYYFRVCPPDPTAEKIVHTNAGPNVRPLVPNKGTVGPPDYGSTYDWSVYVTEAANAPSAGAYRINAIVTWTPAQRRGVRNSVDVNTLMYSPTGSVDSSTHPFTGPRQAYFFASGSAGGGRISVSGTVGGVSFEQMAADFSEISSTVQTEQTIRTEGATYAPGLVNIVGGVETSSAGTSASSQADTDPVTLPGTYQRSLVSPQAFGFQQVGSASTYLLSWTDGGDQGESTSATAAGGASACNLQTDGLPCAYGAATQPDSGNESPYGDFDTSVFLVVPNIGVVEIMRMGSLDTPITAYTRRTGGGPSGLVRGNVSWRLPEIWLGGLPKEFDNPSNWSGYWVRLADFVSTAQAESGPGGAAPTYTVAGTLQSWRGGSYETRTVPAAGGRIRAENLDITDQNVGPNRDKVTVQITGKVGNQYTLSTERSTTVRAQQAGANTEATANIGSPIVGEFRYRLLVNDVVQADLTISFNAGRGRVSTSYRRAPA
ncbi:MAG TPA: prepilin-type N-terminal cleavage/methylation domain-containing protein [Actinomycetota bacterium]|nr:prepilin-type N-terminal cleavage/methylation domain-containing protein [Actinomycetota bacterium]